MWDMWRKLDWNCWLELLIIPPKAQHSLNWPLNRQGRSQDTIIPENNVGESLDGDRKIRCGRGCGKVSEPFSGVDAITAVSKGPKNKDLGFSKSLGKYRCPLLSSPCNNHAITAVERRLALCRLDH
jgi:hypothetical protein